MKLAFFDYTLDTSVRVYIDNVTRNLEGLGVELLPFDARRAPPEEAHLYWDPRLTGASRLPISNCRSCIRCLSTSVFPDLTG